MLTEAHLGAGSHHLPLLPLPLPCLGSFLPAAPAVTSPRPGPELQLRHGQLLVAQDAAPRMQPRTQFFAIGSVYRLGLGGRWLTAEPRD